jgi:tetraacyldisaccharide 4'-kinase
MRLRARPLAWTGLDRSEVGLEELRGKAVLGFCGIGNPEAFRRQLIAVGVELSRFLVFRDHHDYTPGDLEAIRVQADRRAADAVVMTQKDAVKLGELARGRPAGDRPWLYLKIAQTVESGEEAYRGALAGLAKRRGAGG